MLVPATVDEPVRIRCGAEQPFQAVLTGVERQILDLMAQNQHLFQYIFHNGVPEHLVGIHQVFVGAQRNNINLR